MLVEFVVGYLGDTLIEKVKDYLENKTASRKMINEIQERLLEFEGKNDGTIIVNGAFISYNENFKILNKIIENVFEPDREDYLKTDFIKAQVSGVEAYCVRKKIGFKIYERYLVNDFYEIVYDVLEKYARDDLDKSDRYILYAIFQTRKSFEDIIEDLKSNDKEQLDKIETIIRGLNELRKEIYADELIMKLTDEWFVTQNRVAIANMGTRYLPEMNVPLRINERVEFIDRGKLFKQRVIATFDEALIEINKTRIDRVRDISEKVASSVIDIPFHGTTGFDFKEIINDIGELIELIQSEIDATVRQSANSNNYNLYQLNRALSSSYGLVEFLNSEELKLFCNPFLLITGEAGAGKSHLLADTVTNKMNNGLKALLLLGQQFNADDDLWLQIKNQLDIDESIENMLDTLNEIGRLQNSRLIIYIDALNEGGGKDLWRNTLAGILERIKSYDYLGLVCSIRTAYQDTIFDEQLMSKFVVINHIGFSEVQMEAMEKFFVHYNIIKPSFPLLSVEFSNPLFLLMYCEVVSTYDGDYDFISVSEIYRKYGQVVNKRLSGRYNYYESINFVNKLFHEFAKQKLKSKSYSYVMSIDELVEIVIPMSAKCGIAGNIIEGLLSEGILTKGINYRGEEYFYITYERFNDYILARHLLEDCTDEQLINYLVENNRLLHNNGIIDALAVQSPELKNREIYELLPDYYEDSMIRMAFLRSLYWRSDSSVKENSLKYINEVVFKYNNSFELFFEIAILLSSRPNHILNGERLHQFYMSLNMADRDAEFIPLFDKWYSDHGSSISRILEWSLSSQDKQVISNEAIESITTTIAWFAISSNRRLRDKSTKAIISLIKEKSQIAVNLLMKFKDVDDPYVYERLFAVAYGCAVNGLDKESITELAQYIYSTVFSKDEVYPHILLRDYARSVIEYALYIGCEIEYQEDKINAPYKSTFPQIPSDEEIKKYEYDSNDPDFKKHFYSQNEIINSMRVEYTRDGQSGWYGDFGRYTFQSYFYYYKELNATDLMNIAVKMIFDMGYDVEKHGQYDRNIRYISREKPTIERIGKKYQWIALHKLAAYVADNYEMVAPWSQFHEEELISCKGSFEPHVRDIDPTVIKKKENISSVTASKYEISFEEELSTWIPNIEDIPSIDSFIKYRVFDDDYLMISGSYNFDEPKKIGIKKYDIPHRNVWINVRSFFAKEADFDELIEYVQTKNLFDVFPEYPRHSNLFNKEYYYSDAHNFYKNDYYCCKTWSELGFRYTDDNNYKLMHPVEEFSREDGNDYSFSDGIRWWKPTDELVSFFKLEYGNYNTALYLNKKLICFESSELLDTEIGFMFNEKYLLDFLKQNSYKMFFVVTGRKGMLGGNHNERFPMNDFSGIYTYEDSMLNGELKAKVYN